MDWWHWVAAGVAALMVLVLVLLRMDTARERRGSALPGAWRAHAVGVLAVPVVFAVVLFSPLWLALVIIAVPALAIAVMALAS
ncbi:hypothetical protein JL107_07470 [Nakamurella flavida]|uniref:Uncharacterized protein n=1 Tax=Nakamurella flavida TaxID=363630 RepID=A0A938YKL8_9ACTN|nr:hypothetical protein [Nakamurella flavida]MBM9476276.1 hypothetical protein [Nakamurella flavida]MDP9779624.1 uncharacterized membrane protein YhaH (DUF805 family) [Nakamurella flavida]